jgi:DNA polymerase III sliding clamp (beta) subunit (PCNA family)
MMGLLLELEPHQLRAVSTDGHRLSRYTQPLETGSKEKLKVIVPSRVFNIVQKSLRDEDSVEISVSTKAARIQFKFGATVLVASLIAENYPNYEAVIPLENDKKLVVNRAHLASTVKRVARFSSRGDVPMKALQQKNLYHALSKRAYLLVSMPNFSKTPWCTWIVRRLSSSLVHPLVQLLLDLFIKASPLTSILFS